MAVDNKYGKITAERGDRVHGSKGVPLNESGDEPVFVIRAQDAISAIVVAEYKRVRLEQSEPPTEEWVDDIDDVIEQFVLWQGDNHELVKLPD